MAKNAGLSGPSKVAYRSVAEWSLKSSRDYTANHRSPFADVLVEADFTGPSGETRTVPGFFDGDGTWRVRFNPDEAGSWTFAVRSRPHDPELTGSGSFEVTPRETRGFLKSTPGNAWGFAYESGEPVFLMGDTVYDTFGMAYCGGDIEGFLKRRVSQGFNLIRARVPCSSFHPPGGTFEWQNREIWAWGGSRSLPRFDLFNLDYFHSIDRTILSIENMGGLGIEMIMEAWGYEFPFNSRRLFTPEWEELWLRYLVARYDAYNCVYFWTPLNEYEFYPDGNSGYKEVSNRWALRMGRWMRATATHGHIHSIHNISRFSIHGHYHSPGFADRFRADPEAIDTVMFQEWGTTQKDDAWLAAGIEEAIVDSMKDWKGTALFAEWGYERNPDFELKLPSHEFCDRDHTRRSAWRGVMCGYGIIGGSENTWGAWMLLDKDLPGVVDMTVLQRFLTETVPFHTLKPSPESVRGEFALGRKPMLLASEARDVLVAYLPVGGTAEFDVGKSSFTNGSWFDPRTGKSSPAAIGVANGVLSASAPKDPSPTDRPADWVLIARK